MKSPYNPHYCWALAEIIKRHVQETTRHAHINLFDQFFCFEIDLLSTDSVSWITFTFIHQLHGCVSASQMVYIILYFAYFHLTILLQWHNAVCVQRILCLFFTCSANSYPIHNSTQTKWHIHRLHSQNS